MKKLLVSAFALCTAISAMPVLADSYDDAVNAAIRKNVEYPRLAKMRELEGNVGFTVKIDPSGAVSDTSIQGSGQASLDNATLDAVKKSAPFPAPTGGPREVHGVVVYKLS